MQLKQTLIIAISLGIISITAWGLYWRYKGLEPNIEQSQTTLEESLAVTDRLLINLLKIQDDKSILINDYFAAVRSFRFIPSKVAIIDITFSGKLENLKNQELKNSILNYYSELDNSLQSIEDNQNLLTDISL